MLKTTINATPKPPSRYADGYCGTAGEAFAERRGPHGADRVSGLDARARRAYVQQIIGPTSRTTTMPDHVELLT